MGMVEVCFMIRACFFLMLLVTLSLAPSSFAAGRGGQSQPSREELKHRYEMSLDVAGMYVRDTRPIGGSDTGAKLNLGGTFTDWIGMDAMAMYEIKSKSFLVGGDIRLMPIEWLFFKAGAGGFSDRETKEFRATPILGAGFMGRFTEYYYMVAEGLYFSGPGGGKNVGFGAGLGFIF